jgi:hypothetical protein
MLQSTQEFAAEEIGMIWTSLKKAAGDFWEEILAMIVFNLITLVGTILIIPWPFVTFGLFEMAYDVGQGKGIKYSAFFTRAAEKWKQAYVWGAINLGAVVVLLVAINFYGSFQTFWAGMAEVTVIGMAIFWFTLQLLVLPIYPRLEEPGFKLAMRNALVLMSRHFFPTLVLAGATMVISLLTFWIPQGSMFLFLGIFAFPAIFCNRLVEAMIRKELGADVGEVEDPGMHIDEDPPQ